MRRHTWNVNVRPETCTRRLVRGASPDLGVVSYLVARPNAVLFKIRYGRLFLRVNRWLGRNGSPFLELKMRGSSARTTVTSLIGGPEPGTIDATEPWKVLAFGSALGLLLAGLVVAGMTVGECLLALSAALLITLVILQGYCVVRDRRASRDTDRLVRYVTEALGTGAAAGTAAGR